MAISLATMISSEATGIPFNPSLVEAMPSFICPPADSPVSSQWLITSMLKSFAYSIASLMRPLFITGLPSSEIATHPASFSSPISARASPFSSLLTAPTGYTFTMPSSCAFLSMYLVTDALSLTGSVFAMQATPVNPPAAAAVAPVFIVSLYS